MQHSLQPARIARNQAFCAVAETSIKIGVSSCLMGQKVRYDATDKLDRYIVETLGEVFELEAVCPEVAVGLGVPRPPIQLEGEPERPRAIGVYDKNIDATEALRACGAETARRLADASGYIFKSRSPSCGLADVPIYRGERVTKRGAGLFAREIRRRLPLMPLIDERGLAHPVARASFIELVFAYRRWQEFLASGEALTDFHRRNTLTLMAHGRSQLRKLERLVQEEPQRAKGGVIEEYGTAYMRALGFQATARRHVNVLRYGTRRLQGQLSPADREMLGARIEGYWKGQLPLAAPVGILRELAQRTEDAFLCEQYYLNPSAAEARLRGMDRLSGNDVNHGGHGERRGI